MPEELQIDYKESTLYSTKGKFTFCFTNLPENAIAVCCYDKGSGDVDTVKVEGDVFDFTGFSEGCSDLKFITIVSTEKGEEYGPECDLTIYYGTINLEFKCVKGVKPNKQACRLYHLVSDDVDLSKIPLHEFLKYHEAIEPQRNAAFDYKKDGVWLSRLPAERIELFFDKDEYNDVFRLM